MIPFWCNGAAWSLEPAPLSCQNRYNVCGTATTLIAPMPYASRTHHMRYSNDFVVMLTLLMEEERNA